MYMSEAEQSRPSELGLADAATAILGLMDGPAPQPKPEKRVEANAEVEETEAAADEDIEALPEDDQASEEYSEDSSDGEESESVEAAEDGEDEAPALDSLVTVKINGKTQQVTLKEAIDGYQRQADYQGKTQALAEQRRALEAERQQSEEYRNYYAQQLQVMDQQLQQILPQEPNWEQLHRDDPINFPIIEKQWRDLKERAAYTQAEQARLAAIASQQEQAQLQQLVSEGQKFIVEKMPEWKDEAKWKAARNQLREYGQKVGYTAEELAQAYDPRAIVLLEKARRYDALQANKPKPQPAGAGPKPMRAGNISSSPRQSTEIAKVKQRLKSSGSVNDAAALFGMLDTRR
jgi:hypothetical protein